MKLPKLILLIITSILLVSCGSKTSHNNAEKNENKDRFITVINKTGEVINEITISIDKGTTIVTDKNLSEDSISFKIPKEYKEHKNFTITLVDRYGSVFETKTKIKKATGRYEVAINSEHKIQEGDIYSKFLNK